MDEGPCCNFDITASYTEDFGRSAYSPQATNYPYISEKKCYYAMCFPEAMNFELILWKHLIGREAPYRERVLIRIIYSNNMYNYIVLI